MIHPPKGMRFLYSSSLFIHFTIFFVKQENIITCFWLRSCCLDSDSYGLLERWRNICNYQRRCNDLLSCWLDSDSCGLLIRCWSICNYQGRSGRHFNRRRDTQDAYIYSLHCTACCSRSSCCCSCRRNNSCCTGPGSTYCTLCCHTFRYWRWRQAFVKVATLSII